MAANKSCTSKAKPEAVHKSSLHRGLVELIRKGGNHQSKPSIRRIVRSSPYAQPVPHYAPIRTSIADLSVIEEKQHLPRNLSFSALRSDSCSPPSQAATQDPAFTLNKTLSEQLKSLPYDVKQRYQVFQRLFSTVISQDSTYGLVLRRIKTGYEEYLSHCVDMQGAEDGEKAARQLMDFQEVLEQEQKEKETLLATIVQLRRDKTTLTSKLMEKTARIKALEKADSVKTSHDETVNSHLISLESEVSVLRSREHLLLSILKSAKQQGFPIDELMRQQRVPSSSDSEDVSEKTLT